MSCQADVDDVVDFVEPGFHRSGHRGTVIDASGDYANTVLFEDGGRGRYPRAYFTLTRERHGSIPPSGAV